MEIEGIGNTVQNSGQNSALSGRRVGLGEEDFLRVLLAQLSYQDPLKPLDNNEFIAQFAQMTTLAETQQLNNHLQSLLSFQSGEQALTLLGRSVEIRNESSSVLGEVIAVAFQNGAPSLTVKLPGGQFIEGVSLGQIAVVQ